MHEFGKRKRSHFFWFFFIVHACVCGFGLMLPTPDYPPFPVALDEQHSRKRSWDQPRSDQQGSLLKRDRPNEPQQQHLHELQFYQQKQQQQQQHDADQQHQHQPLPTPVSHSPQMDHPHQHLAHPPAPSRASPALSSRLHLDNIALELTDEQLSDIFRICGPVHSATVNRPEGFAPRSKTASVVFDWAESAELAAQHLQGLQIMGRTITIDRVPNTRSDPVVQVCVNRTKKSSPFFLIIFFPFSCSRE